MAAAGNASWWRGPTAYPAWLLRITLGKPREVMIGRSHWSSRLRATPGMIAAPLYRRLLARAAVIRR